MRSLLGNPFTCGERLFVEKILVRTLVFAWSDLLFKCWMSWSSVCQSPDETKLWSESGGRSWGKRKNGSAVDGWLMLQELFHISFWNSLAQRSNKTCYTPNGMKSTPNSMKLPYRYTFSFCVCGLRLVVGPGDFSRGASTPSPASHHISPGRRCGELHEKPTEEDRKGWF